MKRFALAVINILLLLTIPIWGGSVIIVLMAFEFIENDHDRARFAKLISGKRFLLQ